MSEPRRGLGQESGGEIDREPGGGPGRGSGDGQGIGAVLGTLPTATAARAYSHFSPDSREYVITDPRPPHPWVNVIANRRVGLVVSQTSSGFSWIDNSQLAAIVR